jgi:hypothetical protein
MSERTQTPRIDHIAIEERARQMRAEAFAHGIGAAWRWLRGRRPRDGYEGTRTA